jgi:predicted PurR-regulated permease PerM
MSQSGPSSPTPQLRRILLGLALGLLLAISLLVLRPFLAPIVWATILAFASWPLYRRLRLPLRRSDTAAAFLMTLLMCCAVVLPLLWLAILLKRELVESYGTLAVYFKQGPHPLPTVIRDIPWLNNLVQAGLDRYASDPDELRREALSWLQSWAGELAGLLGDIGRNLGKLLVTMLTLFFLYRDGGEIVRQARVVVRRFFGDRLHPYIDTAGTMTRAVIYGLLLSAIAQGLMAGIGYRVAGLGSPVLLGVLTGVLSVVPAIGTAIVWVPTSVWLLVTGSVWKAIFLLFWGFLLVHPVDNILRPLLISNVTRVPFLLTMFGAVGGLATFGLVGVFVGPVLLGVAMAIWREWALQEDRSLAANEVLMRTDPCGSRKEAL